MTSNSAAATAGAEPSSRALFFTVFPSIMLPMFLAAVDQTIVATALPAIAGSLGDVERVSWVVVSYLVATTIAAPVYGRLSDVLGRRRMLFVALAVFLLASILCAAAPTVLLLTAARVLQGFGGGGLMTTSQALVGEAVPPRERGRYQGYLASIFVASSTFGPVAGGWLTQHWGWPSVFIVNIPLGIIAGLLALRLPQKPGTGGRLQFDVTGVVLFSAFITSLLLALERIQQFDLAALPLVAAMVIVAAIALVLLLRQERRAASPLLPLDLLKQSAIWRCDLMGAFIGAGLVGMVTFVPIWLQVVRGVGPGQVGLMLLPMTAGIAFGSLFTGRMMAKTQRTAIFPSIGLAFTVCTLVVLALAAPHLSNISIPILFAVYSMTLGTGMPVVQLTVQLVAGRANLGSAAASVQFSRSVGGAFGTAIVGAVLFAVLSATDRNTATLFAGMVERGPVVMASLDAAHQALVSAEIRDAFRSAFLTIAGFVSVALVLAWTIPVRRL
ncbi:MFS transporter [Acidisphaera sp. L21]|uniref:MFS transporter n=1 Tax=Acidisphaera sp. L21 TaxID=1641851 RepID=UPI00131B14E7|nr:MFS transporter [Acidisphaera sp. L21]